MLQYLSAFGVGALLAIVVQFLLSFYSEKKSLIFKEKKEAFIGLLDAYRQVAVDRSEDAVKSFAYWQIRCELVGSGAVVKSIQAIVESNEDRSLRDAAHEELIKQMRIDLGVARK